MSTIPSITGYYSAITGEGAQLIDRSGWTVHSSSSPDRDDDIGTTSPPAKHDVKSLHNDGSPSAVMADSSLPFFKLHILNGEMKALVREDCRKP